MVLSYSLTPFAKGICHTTGCQSLGRCGMLAPLSEVNAMSTREG